jgi:Uma2 family endonuclease
MATTNQVPVETYLRSIFHPDAEYIDGEIRERPMGDDQHSAFQAAICAFFFQYLDSWNIRVRPELRVQVTPGNYLIPDVSILDAANPRERIPTLPPIAAFEVWSPDNKIREMMRKFDMYEQMGISQIWLIDPTDPVWQRYENGRLVDRGIFSQPESGIEFSIDEINKFVR